MAPNSPPPELPGNTKVTRQDWLNVAMDMLVSDGVDQVKVLTLGERLGVSRSSFYWYFKSRKDLLDALLDHWQGINTAAIVAEAERPAATIGGAVLNVFRTVVDPELFDSPLDFAIRDWARRDGHVRRVLDQSDATRLEALTAMFARYGYEATEAQVRARTLYFMQIGYELADLREPMGDRLRLVPHYLRVFTGREPDPDAIEEFRAYFTALRHRSDA